MPRRTPRKVESEVEFLRPAPVLSFDSSMAERLLDKEQVNVRFIVEAPIFRLVT